MKSLTTVLAAVVLLSGCGPATEASRQMKNTCKVLAGTLAPDPYTGTSIRFVYGGASEVDIDHLVALSDAWQKGAASSPAGEAAGAGQRPAEPAGRGRLHQPVQG